MKEDLPQLTALRTFHAVARHAGVAEAAERLNVTVGAVRHQIRRLEEALGEQLLVRSRRTLTLTPRGARLYERLSRAFEEIESACRTASKDDLSGELRVACAPALASLRLMQVIDRFCGRFPLVTVRLFPMEAADESMDVVIAYGERPIPGIRYALLKNEAFFAVCSPELLYRQPVRTIEDVGVVLHADGDEDWQRLARACGKPSLPPRPAIFCPNADLALAGARAGVGVAIGSSILCADDLRRGTLVRVLDVEIPAPHPYFVIQPGGPARDLAEVFSAILLELLEH